MVDSEAAPNLIKLKFVEKETTIDRSDVIQLCGISKIPVDTLGSVKLNVLGKIVLFHVVPDSISIPYAGLLGSNFMKTSGAKLDFEKEFLKIDNIRYPFVKSTTRVENNVMLCYVCACSNRSSIFCEN